MAVAFVGVREQLVSHAEVQRQTWVHAPVVLQVTGGVVVANVAEERRAQLRGRRDAEQEVGEA